MAIPAFRAGQNPAYRPSGAAALEASLRYILCLCRRYTLLISKSSESPCIDKGEACCGCVLLANVVMHKFDQERKENSSSPDLPRVSVEDYMVCPKFVMVEHLGFDFFY